MENRVQTGRRHLVLLLSLFYGASMVWVGGTLYSESPYHRYQAIALLNGHLYLGDSIDQMTLGLAWHNGHVQQVWGLGIGVWLLPFQAIWQLLGGEVFPDRIALGSAFALLAFYACGTGLRIAQKGHKATGLGFVWLILLCPPLWTLTRASQLVFEETVLYGLIISLGILIGLVRVAYFDTRSDYWLVCLLAAFIGLVRPTQIVYGIGAVLVSSLIHFVRRRGIRTIILGNSMLIAGLALLALTNWTRFGSPTEFGHRLTPNSDSMVYLTRFGNPYEQTGTIEAAEELFGVLFLNFNVRDANAFSDDLFPGQSSQTRWRRLYLTLFDPSYVILCLAGIGLSAWWFRRRRKGTGDRQQPESAAIGSLLTWGIFSITALGCFYLRFPIIASRYLLDFLPGLLALVLLAWIVVSQRWPRLSLPLLAFWMLYGFAFAQVPAGDKPRPVRSLLQRSLPHGKGMPLLEYRGNYTPSRHPSTSSVTVNGYGWEPETGFADVLVVLVVDNPQYLELRLSERRSLYGQPARQDVYRAMMDGQSLPFQGVSREGGDLKVMFAIPSELHTGIQLLFLCLSKEYDAEDRASERFLHSIHWR